MLYRNDLFEFGGVQMRLLHADSSTAWAMPLGVGEWPVALPWDTVKSLKAIESPTVTSDDGQKLLAPTAAMKAARDTAQSMLGDLPNRAPEIFDPSTRRALILERSQQACCSPKTLWKHLRRWWEGGQTPAALLGQFHLCGRPGATLTSKRGKKPSADYSVYQVSEVDVTIMRKHIESHYLKDERTSIASSFQSLIERHYRFADGNGQEFVRPLGERPSLKQFDHFLRKQFPLEMRLRRRKGDKDFERDHRPVLGTVLDDCAGVGHYYEADATIADVFLVAEHDVNQIVGKPTIYLIIDRKSRLIVGWYVGLENPSWVCAMQALRSISEDKQAMCARYNVEYNPEDWPAHQVFPQQVLADRGELFTKQASKITENLTVTVTNVQSQRGDWKPIAECGFKLTRMTLQAVTPGFDPPENAKRRQGKKYDKDACLTLREFSSIILLAIIKHNRMPMQAYRLNLRELADQVTPSPIGIWNHNITDRAGVLPRFTEETVRLALLPQGEATVTEHGIVFNGCHYSCQAAVSEGWFVHARTHRTKVVVSYDGRLVDSIIVHDPVRRGVTHRAELLSRDHEFKGLTFSEVKAVEASRRSLMHGIAQDRIQTTADFNDAAHKVTSAALKRLKSSPQKASRSSRRADTKPARLNELRLERMEHAAMPTEVREESAAVISFSDFAETTAQAAVLSPLGHCPVSAALAEPTQPAKGAISLAERARMAREKMLMK
jgi:phage shock protein PspC (stress-responsive transcriptional regulator)